MEGHIYEGYVRGFDGKFFYVEERLYVRGKYHHSDWFGCPTPDEALNYVIRNAGGNPLKLKKMNGVWNIVVRRPFITSWGEPREEVLLLRPYERYREALMRRGIALEPEPESPEDRLRKYASLGYEFQLRRFWKSYYLYARKWNRKSRRREHKYIGPWSEKLKKMAETLGIKITTYDKYEKHNATLNYGKRIRLKN